jgi:sensor histidine kinase YesM
MGRRLAFAIECPAELREIPIAPMLLQPLVENCIEHGLEPKVDGGRIDVSVRRALGTLHIAIADTGLGFFPSDSAGVGLANVRERLQLLYGERARLTVEEQRPEGTLVRIAIADSAPQADTQAAADPPRTQPAGAGPEVPTGPVHAGLLKPGARA